MMSSDEDIQAELLELRKRVEALAAARRSKQSQQQHKEEEAEETLEDEETKQDIKQQIEDLMKLFQEEIRDMPAMPTLGVFMLGILVGRYLR